MLTSTDLLTCDSFIQLTDVSLKLYCDFARDVLMERCFHYYFTDETELEVNFSELGTRHMLGIHHIDGSIGRNAFFDEVDNGLSFADFNQTNGMKKRFKQMKPRIRLFACVYNTLRLGRVFYYPNQLVPNTNDVKLDYILYREIDSKGLNVGIKNINGQFIGTSILVDNETHKGEHTNNNNMKIVKKLSIRENRNNVTLEEILYTDDFIMFAQ